MRSWLIIGSALVAISTSSLLLLNREQPHSAARSVGTKEVVVNPMDLIQDKFVHMPGSELRDDGLFIEPVPFAIVNQDGSGGQPNPPINLYGGHLLASGDFALHAKLKDVTNGASIAFYGQVPIIYDEFRYERSTLQVTFNGSQLTINRWINNSQTPKTTSYSIQKSANHELDFVKSGSQLLLTVDGKQIASLPEEGLFSSGTVWFGASAIDEYWTLSSLVASPRSGDKLEIVNTTSPSNLKAASNGLQTLVQNSKRKDVTIGAAAALAPLMSDPDYANVLYGNFGGITTENALKWQFVHPTLDTYDFKEADALIDLALQHNMKVHGHPLVFGEANPRWVQDMPTKTATDKQHVEAVMLEHIRTVVGHFANKMTSWDVINEPLADYDQFENGQMIRDSVWSRAMGESYIAKAFTTARQTDPNAKLFINEFGLEEDGERWDYFFSLVKRLKSQGVPIDGVGFQAHVYESGDRINTATLKSHMNELAKIGLLSRISENDVYSDDGQQVQAAQYAAVLKACLDTPSCTSYTTWGVSDRYDMFRDDDNSLQYGEDFLWDKNMQPTPAVDAMRKIIISQ